MAKIPYNAPPFFRGLCKSRRCNRQIVRAQNLKSEKIVPLDPVAMVYAVRINAGRTVCVGGRDWIRQLDAKAQTQASAYVAMTQLLAKLRNELATVQLPPGIIDEIELMHTRAVNTPRIPADQFDGVMLYVTHFATCPDANRFTNQTQKNAS